MPVAPRLRRYPPRVLARTALLAAALAAGALMAASTQSSAADAKTHKPRPISQSPRLWATVNVCDTAKHPNAIGLRASMPGSGKRGERMYVRFRLEFFQDSDGRWHDLGPSGDSGFFSLGSAKYTRREGGRNFVLAPPPEGKTYRVRGVVDYQWRKGRRVVRSARKWTRPHKGRITGADPKGFSAADCTISAP